MWTFLIALAKLAVLLLPALAFPGIYLAYLRTRRYRETEINGLENTISHVRPEQQKKDDGEVITQLKADLDFLYNWRNYAVPIIMSSLATLIATFAALSRVHVSFGMHEIQDGLFGRIPPAVLAGIGGAYFATLVDLTERARLWKLSSSYFQVIWVKLAGGAMLGYLAFLVVQDNLALLTAFGLGVLPLKEGLDWVKDKTREKLGTHAKEALPSEKPTLHHLQGMTEDVIDTLDEYGIKSTQQLAYANASKLLARTNLEWVVILDFIDQALLFNYFGSDASKFRTFGIRGAIEMGTLYDELHLLSDRHDEAKATLEHLTMIMPSMNEASLKHTICTLHEDLAVRNLAGLFGSRLTETTSASMAVPTV